MATTKRTLDELAALGGAIFDRQVRPALRPEDDGKFVAIDVETGDYEIGDDADVDAPLRLHAKHPGAAVYTLRIGYNAAVALGGVLERTA